MNTIKLVKPKKDTKVVDLVIDTTGTQRVIKAITVSRCLPGTVRVGLNKGKGAPE